MEATPERNNQLWKIAQKRAAFKKHLATYFVMNAFFWALWLFARDSSDTNEGWPWPVWPMLGWGIGVAFDYIGAYHDGKTTSAEKEYEKLKREREGK